MQRHATYSSVNDENHESNTDVLDNVSLPSTSFMHLTPQEASLQLQLHDAKL